MKSVVTAGFIKGLLSWLQYLVNSLIGLIGGTEGSSLISFLARYWKGILVFLFIIGCGANIVIYMIRWRPQWWWFAKKRMIIDDSILEPKGRKKTAVKPSTIVPVQKKKSSKPSRDLPGTDGGDLMEPKKKKTQ